MLFPCLDAHNLSQFPEEQSVEDDVHEHIVALVQLVHQLAQTADGEGCFPLFAADFLFDAFQQAALHGAGLHKPEQPGIRSENLQFLAVHGLYLGNLSGKGKSGNDKERPNYSPHTCRQVTGNDQKQTYTVDTRNGCRQHTQESALAKYPGTCRPCFQLGFIGCLAFMQQAEDTEPLAEFQFGSKFAYGSLALQYILFLCKMLPQPVGQQASSRFGTGTVDVLEQRMRTEYIQVVSIQMCRVCKFLAAVEAGCVIVQRSQLLPVDLCLLFQIIFAVKQAVVVFYQENERQQGDKCNARQHCPTFRPEIDNPRNSCHEQQQPQCADAINLLLYFIQFASGFILNTPVDRFYIFNAFHFVSML